MKIKDKRFKITALYERLSKDDEVPGRVKQYRQSEADVDTVCRTAWV